MVDVKVIGQDDLAWSASMNQFNVYFLQYIAPSNAILNSIRVVSSSNCDIKLAIYSDSGGEPSGRLAASSGAIYIGATVLAISPIPLVAGRAYWIGTITSASAVRRKPSGTTPGRSKAETYATYSFPESAGAGYSNHSSSYIGLSGWGTVGASVGASVGLIGDALVGDRVLFGSDIFFG
jgi:hypothetical protein